MFIQESILMFFQNSGTAFFDRFFVFFTMFGEQNILIAVIVWIFWNVDKKKGFILIFTLLISLALNMILKISFHQPRPFEVIQELSAKRIHTATGYSFPSGHSQGAATIYLTLAIIFKKKWLLPAALFISILVAVSRVYLGVHWPVDVIAGLLLGFAVSIIMYRILNTLYEKVRTRDIFILAAGGAGILVLLIFILISVLFFDGKIILTDLVKIMGLFTGASGGFFLEERKAIFSDSGSIIIKVFRFIVGLGCTISLLWGLKIIFPEAGIFYFIRYAIVGLWVTWLFPAVGLRLGLFYYSDRS